MNEFLATILGYPTVVFTVMLVFVLVYWSLVIVGALDLDTSAEVDTDFDIGGETDVDFDIGGHADADADFDVGGHAHGDADVDIGHHEHGLAHADGDFDSDVGGDADSDGHGFAKLVNAVGLAGVPLTVAVSFVVFFSWSFSLLAAVLMGTHAPGVLTQALVGTGVGMGAFLASIPCAAVATRPLRGMFVVHKAARNRSLVGRLCEISTGRVDAKFGQAEVADGGAGFLVQVRNLRENELKRGSKAVIYEYDRENEVFLVAPVDDTDVMLGERRQTRAQTFGEPDQRAPNVERNERG